MFKTSITDTSFNAGSKVLGTYPHNSPIFFIFQCPLVTYRAEHKFIDTILEEIETNALYASLEHVVEKVNKKISKTFWKGKLSLALFQKEGRFVRVAAYPNCLLHYQVSTQENSELRQTTLSFADTNRIFSEILEVDSQLSEKMIFSFAKTLANENHIAIEGNTITVKLQKKENLAAQYLRSLASKRILPLLRVYKTRRESQKNFFTKSGIKYAIALFIAILTIAGINNAKTNKLLKEKQASDQPWTQAEQAHVQPIINIKEKVPSQYVHEQEGIIKAGTYLFTYQSEPNIILQINEQTQEVKPIVIDSQRIGKLTGMKKLSEEILLFTHNKDGLIFLKFDDQRWRLVEFKKPKIVEYTDVAVYNNFIYVLDARSRQIWKLAISEQELTGTPWVRDDRVDLSLASSMTIDGSIYLTMMNGEVIKMTQGKKDPNFVVSPKLSPILANANKIIVGPGDDTLTILDRLENRLIVIKNNGDFVLQYRLTTVLPADDLFVDGEGMYVLIREEITKLVPQ